MALTIQTQVVQAGTVASKLLVAHEPLSFWGGYDADTGNIIDQRHPLAGQCGAGRILALPYTRGSSTTTAILLEAIKAGTAPLAIITTAPDSFFALASIVADEMYGTPVPLFVVPEAIFMQLQTGMQAQITTKGVLHLDIDDVQ